MISNLLEDLHSGSQVRGIDGRCARETRHPIERPDLHSRKSLFDEFDGQFAGTIKERVKVLVLSASNRSPSAAPALSVARPGAGVVGREAFLGRSSPHGMQRLVGGECTGIPNGNIDRRERPHLEPTSAEPGCRSIAVFPEGFWRTAPVCEQSRGEEFVEVFGYRSRRVVRLTVPDHSSVGVHTNEHDLG
jgi:hypothetical protein